MDPIAAFTQQSHKVVEEAKTELKSIRTGRATTSLIENVSVQAYQGQSTLKLLEMASITTEGPNALAVTPYDPSTIKDVEKAILKSPLGLTPGIQGNRMVIRIPPLTEEQREKILKVINQIVEEKKGMVRNNRDAARKDIKSSFESKSLTEDDKYRLEKSLDEEAKKVIESLDQVRESKEKDIKEI